MRNITQITISAAAVAATLIGLPAYAGTTFHAHRPINEGGDTRPCVTYKEVLVGGRLDGRQDRIQRILDTPGVKVSKHAIEDYGMPDVVGVDEGEVVTAPHKYREVRSYPMCPEVGGTFLIEFDKRTDRAVQSLYV